MYKVRPVFHAGIEFVQISNLPPSQAERLVEKIPQSSMMQIQFGEELLIDCIKYDEYEKWYQLIRVQDYDNYLDTQI